MSFQHTIFSSTALSSEHTELRRQLRQQLRVARRQLTSSQQQQAAYGLKRQLQHLLNKRPQSIAAYCANDGEIDATLFLAGRNHIYYPVLQNLHAQGVVFRQAAGNKRWRQNRWGIAEPTKGRQRPAWTLDVLLLPLVGFTLTGHRLGMGGGYYDRLLASFKHRPRKPLLIGLAHDCQQLNYLPLAPWDQPIEYVVTGSRIIRASSSPPSHAQAL